MSQSTAARAMPRPVTRPVARPAAPRLRVVAPRPDTSSTTRIAVASIVLLGAGLIALLLLNISIGNGAYELTALQKTQLQMTENAEALAEQVDTMSAPQMLADRAAALGMVPAPNTAFVRLSDGTVIGTAATAKAPPKPALKAKSVLAGSAAATKAGDLTRKTATKQATAKQAATTKKATTADKATTAEKATTKGTKKATSTATTTTP